MSVASSYASTVILMLEGSTPNVRAKLGLCLRDGERLFIDVAFAQFGCFVGATGVSDSPNGTTAIAGLAMPAPAPDSLYRTRAFFLVV